MELCSNCHHHPCTCGNSIAKAETLAPEPMAINLVTGSKYAKQLEAELAAAKERIEMLKKALEAHHIAIVEDCLGAKGDCINKECWNAHAWCEYANEFDGSCMKLREKESNENEL